jgi:hypothetical protein
LTARTSPTTVSHGALVLASIPPVRMRFPIASSPGQRERAIDSSTMITLGLLRVSAAVKSRPAIKGMPIASKYRPAAVRWSALMNRSPGSAARPSTVPSSGSRAAP